MNIGLGMFRLAINDFITQRLSDYLALAIVLEITFRIANRNHKLEELTVDTLVQIDKSIVQLGLHHIDDTLGHGGARGGQVLQFFTQTVAINIDLSSGIIAAIAHHIGAQITQRLG